MGYGIYGKNSKTNLNVSNDNYAPNVSMLYCRQKSSVYSSVRVPEGKV